MASPQTNLRVRISADLADIKAGLATLRGDLQTTKRNAAASMDGLDSAGAKVKNFVGSATAAFAALAGVIGGAVAAIKSAIDRADELGKAAQKVGIGTQALSELAFAAELADVSLGTLSTALTQFNKQLTSNEDLVKELGIETRDASGQFRATEQIISDLADVFRDLPDGPQKATLAVKIFGRAGADLIPLLNSGSDALAEMAQEARDLGVSISAEAAAQAEAFNDNLTRLRSAAQGFANDLAAQLLPALGSLAETQADNARGSSAAGEAATVFATALKLVASVALIAKNVFEGVLNVIFFLVSATSALSKALTVNLGGAFQLLVNYWNRLKDEGPIAALKAYVKEAADFARGERNELTDVPLQVKAAWDAMRQGLNESGEDIGTGLANIFSEMDRGTASANEGIRKLGEESAASEARVKELQATLQRLLGKSDGAGDADAKRRAAEIEREIERAAREAEKAKEEEERLLRERGERISAGLFEVQNELLQATGRGAEAAFRELEARYAQLLADLRGASDVEGEALLERLLGLKKVQIKLEDFRSQVQAVLGGLSDRESSIGDQASGGLIGSVEAEREIARARDESLQKLVDLRSAVQDYYATTKDPSVLAFLQELDGNIGKVSESQQKLRQQVQDVATDALSNFFSDLATGAKSAKDALRDFVLGFVQGMAQIAARALATFLVLKLLDAIYPGLGKATAASLNVGVGHGGGIAGRLGIRREGVSPLLFGGAPRYHGGGIAGLAPDEVPAILRKGEEVITDTDPRHRDNGGRGGGSRVTTPIVAIGDDAVANALAGRAGEDMVVTHVRNNWEALMRGSAAGA